LERVVELEADGEAVEPEEEEEEKPKDDLVKRLDRLEEALRTTLEGADLRGSGRLEIMGDGGPLLVIDAEGGAVRIEGKDASGTGRFLLTATSDLTGFIEMTITPGEIVVETYGYGKTAKHSLIDRFTLART